MSGPTDRDPADPATAANASDPGDAAASTEPTRPVLWVIRGGKPSDEELAALVAVVAARTSGAPSEEAPPALRPPLSRWVASGLVKGTRTKA